MDREMEWMVKIQMMWYLYEVLCAMQLYTKHTYV